MNKCDANEAVNFIKKYLDDMINERVPMNKLIITKKLNSYYKNPKQIAHKVLADRMGERMTMLAAIMQNVLLSIKSPPDRRRGRVRSKRHRRSASTSLQRDSRRAYLQAYARYALVPLLR